MTATASINPSDDAAATVAGYRTFSLGQFTFMRDEYFVTLTWPAKSHRQSHIMSAVVATPATRFRRSRKFPQMLW